MLARTASTNARYGRRGFPLPQASPAVRFQRTRPSIQGESVERAEHPNRKGHPGRGGRSRRAALRGADRALPAELPDLRGADAPGNRRRAGARQEGGGAREPGPRPDLREQGRRHRGGGGRGARRRASGRVPPPRLADRKRHPVQHEHERGAREPLQRDPRRAARRGAADPPERRREPGQSSNDVFPTAMHVAAVLASRSGSSRRCGRSRRRSPNGRRLSSRW